MSVIKIDISTGDITSDTPTPANKPEIGPQPPLPHAEPGLQEVVNTEVPKEKQPEITPDMIQNIINNINSGRERIRETGKKIYKA